MVSDAFYEQFFFSSTDLFNINNRLFYLIRHYLSGLNLVTDFIYFLFYTLLRKHSHCYNIDKDINKKCIDFDIFQKICLLDFFVSIFFTFFVNICLFVQLIWFLHTKCSSLLLIINFLV